MAKDKKVEQITDMEVDFAQWFTDVCKKAQLIDYSSIKGIFIYRPYGYAIWENIQNIMDKEFKKQGVENVYMPLLIPESLLQKEKDHVEGFAPECAWVTMGGGDKLEEKMAIRPTSETLFCEHFANVLQSHRDLPMKYNQCAPFCVGRRLPVLSCVIVSSCGRRAIPSTPLQRKPRNSPRPC